MTAQEALKIIKGIKKTHQFLIQIHSTSPDDEKIAIYDTAIQALEKQIPKKPEYDENTGIYTCPNCRNVSAYDVSAFGDYCENCGQAIKKE